MLVLGAFFLKSWKVLADFKRLTNSSEVESSGSKYPKRPIPTSDKIFPLRLSDRIRAMIGIVAFVLNNS